LYILFAGANLEKNLADLLASAPGKQKISNSGRGKRKVKGTSNDAIIAYAAG
jgi:hypothetical protein